MAVQFFLLRVSASLPVLLEEAIISIHAWPFLTLQTAVSCPNAGGHRQEDEEAGERERETETEREREKQTEQFIETSHKNPY